MVPDTRQFVFPRFKVTIINQTFQMIILGREFIAPLQPVQAEIQDQSLILAPIWLSLVQIDSFLNVLVGHVKYILSQLRLIQ